MQRHGEAPALEPLTLATGDVLLLEGSWRALDGRLEPDEVLVVAAAFVVTLATGGVPAAGCASRSAAPPRS